MSEVQPPAATGTDPAAGPADGILWPIGARLASAMRSMLWLAPLLGGLMLLVHFWRVGYLPALSFSELGVVLGAFGLFVAIGLVAALLLILFPMLFIRQWMSAGLMPAPPRMQLPIQKRQRRSLSRQPLSLVEEDASPAKRRAFSRKIVPGSFAMFWLGSTIAIVLTAAVLHFGMRLEKQWQSTPTLLLVGGGSIISLWLLIWCDFGVHAKVLRIMRHGPMQFLLLLMLYLVLWPAFFSLYFQFDAMPDSAIERLLLWLFALFLLPFFHWIWYASMRAAGPGVMKVRIVILAVVLAYTGLAPSLLDGAASNYGFGMMRKVDLVLSARGCAIVKEALPGQGCEPLPAKGDDDSRVYRLHGVDVLTRIGASYVIAPAGGIDDRKLPRLALPADEVHALVRRIETKQ